MTLSLAEKLPDGSGKAGIRVWLKSSGYARRLLLGEAGDPWLNAAGYLAFFSQAHGLLRPDAAVLDVDELLASWAGRHPDLLTEMGSKRRTSFPLRKLLEATGPRELLAEILTAVDGCLRGQAPAVLSLPTPRRWLSIVNAMVGRDDVEIEADDIEDAAMYVADFLRALASAPVGGIVLDDQGVAAQADDAERCRSIVNIARHYRWGIVWRTNGDADFIKAMVPVVDGVISASPVAATDKPSGVDVTSALWGGGALPTLAAGQFYFAEIPADQVPESVLEKLGLLRN